MTGPKINTVQHLDLRPEVEDKWQPACTIEPELWFSAARADEKYAIAKCRQCPVMEQCAELGKAEEFGVWGATPPRARRKAVRAAKQAHYNSRPRVAVESDVTCPRCGIVRRTVRHGRSQECLDCVWAS